MTHSALASKCIHSPNGYFPRSDSIRKITIHHMAGVMSAEQCGAVFANPARQASSNYGIGNDGTIACYVEEENAAWTSSSYWNDNQAVTMEVSNSYAGDPWPISDAAWNAMIALCADICLRYGIEPSYTGGTDGTFTEHRMYAATGCPGQYIHERMQQIVKAVKAAMNNTAQWIKSDKTGKWWYRHADGSWTSNGWEYIDGEWYYFDKDGWMATGWVEWDGSKFYCGKSGAMVTGAQTIGGKSYFFDGDGRMFTGFRKGKSGAWYCYGKSGAMVKASAIKAGATGKVALPK